MAAETEVATGENREGDAPVRDRTLLANGFDATVLGERDPSLRELIFGEFDERVIAESLGAVLAVRREEAEEAP